MSEPLPHVEFATLVLSLSQSALVHLGQTDDPQSLDGAPVFDLAMAGHTIDLLGLLQEKTKGNLTDAEERLLGSVLLDLRSRFADVSAGPGS